MDDRDEYRDNGDFIRRYDRLYLRIRRHLRQQQVPQQLTKGMIVAAVFS